MTTAAARGRPAGPGSLRAPPAPPPLPHELEAWGDAPRAQTAHGERRLLTAILLQALSDLRISPERLKAGRRHRYRRPDAATREAIQTRAFDSALWFLFKDPDGFPTLASWLGLEVDAVRENTWAELEGRYGPRIHMDLELHARPVWDLGERQR